MKAIILAAGKGTRLSPLTDDKPKCLVSLREKPLLQYQLDAMNFCNITDISIVCGYKASALESYPLKSYLNSKYDNTNMVYSLFCAEKEFTEDLIISYGDILYEPKVLRALIASEANISVAVDRGWRELWKWRMEDPLEDAETLKINLEGNIYELGKKPKGYQDIEGQYIGLIKLKASVLPKIAKFYHEMDPTKQYDGQSFENMYMTSFLQNIANELMDISAVYIDHGWLEVDTTEDLKCYQDPKFTSSGLFNFTK